MIIKKPFYFIRHGQTDWKAQKRIMGQADIPLNQEGIDQALRVKAVVEALPICHIFYSPLQRTAKTAALICQNRAIPKVPSDVLKEMHLGAWSVIERHKLSSRVGIKPPGGESWDQFIERVRQGINEILIEEREGPILLVSHGGVYDALLFLLEAESAKLANCQLAFFEPFPAMNKGWNITMISG